MHGFMQDCRGSPLVSTTFNGQYRRYRKAVLPFFLSFGFKVIHRVILGKDGETSHAKSMLRGVFYQVQHVTEEAPFRGDMISDLDANLTNEVTTTGLWPRWMWMCFARVIFPKYYLQQEVKLQDCTCTALVCISPLWLVVSFSSGRGVLRSSSLGICISVSYDGSHGWHLQTRKYTTFQTTVYRHTESQCNDWQDETNTCPFLWQL